MANIPDPKYFNVFKYLDRYDDQSDANDAETYRMGFATAYVHRSKGNEALKVTEVWRPKISTVVYGPSGEKISFILRVENPLTDFACYFMIDDDECCGRVYFEDFPDSISVGTMVTVPVV